MRRMPIVLPALVFLLLTSPTPQSVYAQDQQKTVVIRFMAPVQEQSVNMLLSMVDQQVKSGVGRIILLVSSPGGEVLYGLSAYNYLKAVRVQLITYNFGAVDSAGLFLYCASSERHSVPNGAFLIHGVATNFPQTPIEQDGLEQALRQASNQTDALVKVLSDCTGQKREKIIAAIKDKTVLSAADAVKFGLVQKIDADLFPLGSQMASVGADSFIPTSLTPIPKIANVPMWNGFTNPKPLSFVAPSITSDNK